VSLLMDALKLAEQAKKRGQTTEQSQPVPPLTLEAAQKDTTRTPSPPLVPAAEAALPELPRLEALDDEFLAHVKQPALRTLPTTPSHSVPNDEPNQRPRRSEAGTGSTAAQDTTRKDFERSTVRNAFAVKQTVTPGRSFLITILALTTIAAVLIGTYFWLQLRPVTGLATKSPAVAGNAQAVAGFPVSSPTATISAPAVLPPARALQTHAKESSKAAAATGIVEDSRANESVQARVDAGMVPIRISKSRSRHESAGDEAYAALQGGDVAAARAAYGKLLDHDPRSVEALHGLAAIALREGRLDDAHGSYQRILEIDPRDAIANAGLIGMKSDADPIAAESRLKNLISAQPDKQILSFALGNLYAGQGRWSEAQAAYFNAYSADSENPDYAFNLAVSLDQLHQAKLARQYYEKALSASANRPAAFDRNQAASRLRDLQH